MNPAHLWHTVNKELIAKAIGELTFEEVIQIRTTDAGMELHASSGAVWKFEGIKGVWGSLKVNPCSITRNGNELVEASEFFLDIQKETGMTDIIQANFFEEMHNTLLADLSLKKLNHQICVRTLADLNGEQLQKHLTGHPKILLSKGRVGWTALDREKYSPESAKPFQLHWIAVRKSLVTANSYKTDPKYPDHVLLPVHPWQWDRYISTQFIGEIFKGDIISLGEMGDYYLPQTSIRTLSNVTHPMEMDVKLPLSILNTSCVRGLPARHLETGEALSKKLEEICKNDPKLKNVKILKESFGASVRHTAFIKVTDAPYRYHELLGAVYRESAQSKLNNNEKAILTAALFHEDHEGKALIGEYIERSGMKIEEWLKAFFEATLAPLLHLQVHYGVGLVAHGQNIVLILEDNKPKGMILKDFHGDLRLSNELPVDGKKAFGDLTDKVTTLPPHYLIHDLITGSLITVHRFISLLMKVSMNFSEEKYYGIMAQVISIEPGADKLLRPEFEKLLLNRVRFNIGYGDSETRPLPMLGGPLKNPLAQNYGKHV